MWEFNSCSRCQCWGAGLRKVPVGSGDVSEEVTAAGSGEQGPSLPPWDQNGMLLMLNSHHPRPQTELTDGIGALVAANDGIQAFIGRLQGTCKNIEVKVLPVLLGLV